MCLQPIHLFLLDNMVCSFKFFQNFVNLTDFFVIMEAILVSKNAYILVMNQLFVQLFRSFFAFGGHL